jgi:hypothetical protein
VTGTGRERQRHDQGQRRRWGWAPVEPGLTPLGTHLESARQLHGHTQAVVARAAGLRTADYRALLKRDVPPITFDQLVSLAAAAGADPVRCATCAWSMSWEEALELGLQPLEADSTPVMVSQPRNRPSASTGRVYVNRRR